ncbi:MAG: hypothetical protein RLQ25_07955 [Alphaproteobacteria bacterium]
MLAAIYLWSAPGPAAANETERSEPQGQQAVATSMAIQDVLRMDRSQFKKFIADWNRELSRDKGRTLTISGFSEEMTNWIISGAVWRPDLFRRLLHDLNGVTDQAQRIRILTEAGSALEQEETNLAASVARLRAASSESGLSSDVASARHRAYLEEAERHFAAGRALTALKVWIEFPQEGTRP